MTNALNDRYRDILIEPIKECSGYTPKFGHGRNHGFSLPEFQKLYGSDAFYKWLGLDSPLMYSAHKVAGGITSIYRQIGIGCERLVRGIFMDYLGLDANDVAWAYEVTDTNGKKHTLSLDGRIIIDKIQDNEVKKRCTTWMMQLADKLELTTPIRKAVTGVVFEVRPRRVLISSGTL